MATEMKSPLQEDATIPRLAILSGNPGLALTHHSTPLGAGQDSDPPKDTKQNNQKWYGMKNIAKTKQRKPNQKTKPKTPHPQDKY